MKKLYGLLAVVFLVMACVPMVTVYADDPAGQWVLDSVEDTTQEDYYSSDSESGDGWFIEDEAATKFQYARSNFGMDWYSEVRTEEGTKRGEGTMHASFSVLPESFKANELQGVTVDLASTFLQINTDGTGFDPDAVATATITCSQYLFEGGNANEIAYDIPVYPSSDYAMSEVVTFTAPSTGDALTFDFTLSVPYVGTLGTSYTYKWVGSETKQSQQIDLKGVVLSAEAKPMPWMKLSASVFYGTDTYTGAQPDAVIEGATDHQGRYSLKIPIPEDSEGPVGIMLKGTLTCVYPYNGGNDVFYFVDMQDTASKDTDEISLATWITVNPDDEPKADAPISVYRLLAFYHLGLDAWSFDFGLETAGPDPLYLYSQNADATTLLQNYSTLYTAAFDAWFLGAAVLGEQESLVKENIRIEVRWPVTQEVNCSHFSPEDVCVRLEETDSKRDDNSRFTILHELGHAFDYITNGNVYRAYSLPSEGNVNHGGYMNDSTSDSYIEGFATFFAGTVQLYSGYPNPNVLSWIDLGTPDQYSIWEADGKYEELAIASLLYHTHFLIDDVSAYWALLDTDRANFYAYYQALDAYLAQNNADGEKALEDQAYATGLFKMPFGNSVYDAGEPYQDVNENGTWDSGEPFGDLMYDTNEDGAIDTTTPLQALDRDDLVMGQSSDALRNRDAAAVQNTIQPVENSYIYLTGEPVDYVLVDILPDGEEGTRSLMGVSDGRVLVGLPSGARTGRVVLSIPGGGTIFEGDLAELQQRFSDTVGQTAALAEVTVSANDLASDDVQATATYGSTDVSGIFTVPDVNQQELIQRADGYDGSAGINQVIAELTSRTSDGTGWQPADDNGEDWSPYDDATGRNASGGSLAFIIIGIVLILGAVATVIAVVLVHRRKSRMTIPQAGARYCSRCGQIVAPGSGFCMNCGAPQSAPVQSPYGFVPQKKSSALLIIGIVAAVLMLIGGVLLFIYAGQDTENASEPLESSYEVQEEDAFEPDMPADVADDISEMPEDVPESEPDTVSNQVVTVSMDYDSGEGVYTGEVNSDGVPDGNGSFVMVSSDTGTSWSYDGQWVNGVITGEGVMTQGDFIFTGSFNSGLLDGYCEIMDTGILRYAGICAGGNLHGQGTLYTSSGMLLFEGEFDNDMLVESEASRQARGAVFKPECADMDDMLYDACMAEDNIFGYPVAVWGFPIAMGEQTSNGTIVIGHMGDDSYPICLVYRYGVDEPKMTSDDWINAWGVVVGLYEYVDGDGLTVTCPMIEVIFWDNEQEGL
jgi:flagellar basal body-associated protein FliL